MKRIGMDIRARGQIGGWMIEFNKINIGHIGDPIPKNNTCKCCGGSGVQRNFKMGLKVVCPCCNGSGVKHKIYKSPYNMD